MQLMRRIAQLLLPTPKDSVNVFSCIVVLSPDTLEQLEREYGRTVIGFGPDGQEPPQSDSGTPVVEVLCLAKDASTAEGHVLAYMKGRFGSSFVLGTSVSAITKGAEHALAAMPANARAGHVEELKRLIFWVAAGDSHIEAVDAVSAFCLECWADAGKDTSKEPLWFLRVEIKPVPRSPQADEFGGAYAKVFVTASDLDEAQALAVCVFIDTGWEVLGTVESAQVGDVAAWPDSRSEIEEARTTGWSSTIYAWPREN